MPRLPEEISTAGVRRRRISFFLLNLILFSAGIAAMSQIVAVNGWTVLNTIVFALFSILLAQVVYGFSVALTGFWLLQRGGDPIRITNTLEPGERLEVLPNTAIVMPVFNEEVSRVFGGLESIYESLQKTGRAGNFDIFILSDSNDPNHWIEEERTWLELCKKLKAFGRVFYRKRRVTLNHKSGNIADFCRRWGARYRYMIVLDADSIMSGQALVRLVELMERNLSVGIIQTCPQQVLGRTLFQRIQQFGARACGPLFSAGASFWHLGGGSFWGHNAIIRLRPFMTYCALPELPKFGALGGRILSHDTVEAALMRKAGYGVWTAYDLEGSYEEGPPDIISSLKRDRRWCQGNLQHLLILFARGLKPASRLHVLLGIMSYLSSPLWLLFMILSALAAFQDRSRNTAAVHAGFLFSYILTLLLLPKILALIRLISNPEQARKMGGSWRAGISVLCEMVFSTLLAPIQMIFYTKFVFSALTGTTVKWGPQKRGGDEGPDWRELWRAHGGQTLIGLMILAVLAWVRPSYLPWMAPVLAALIFSMSFSRVTASVRWGEWARAKGLFQIPEEIERPAAFEPICQPSFEVSNPFFQQAAYRQDYGLLQAVLDPFIHALHVSLLRQREQSSEKVRDYSGELTQKLLTQGPAALTPEERVTLLWDSDSILWLHKALWFSPASTLHEWWQHALRHYNETMALSVRRSVT